MNFRGVAVRLVLLGVATGLRAQPEAEVRHAIDRLFEARTYTWEEKAIIDFDSKGKAPVRTPNTAEGETEIGGFTRLTSYRRVMILLGEQTVFQLKAGWRHGADLTEDDLQELRFNFTGARAQDRMRNYTHVLPHDLLRVLLEAGTNFRKEGSAVIADLDPAVITPTELETYVSTGRRPVPQVVRNALGIPVPVRRRPPGVNANTPRVQLVFQLAQGAIEEFAVETRSTTNISFDGGPREPHDATRTFRFRLRDAGRTRVVVDGEAKALFLDAAAGR